MNIFRFRELALLVRSAFSGLPELSLCLVIEGDRVLHTQKVQVPAFLRGRVVDRRLPSIQYHSPSFKAPGRGSC